MQIEGRKLIFIMNFSVLNFFKSCLQNTTNCTDFSLDFQNFPREHTPRSPRYFLFVSLAIPGSEEDSAVGRDSVMCWCWCGHSQDGTGCCETW